MSRADLARGTGLSRTTVSSLVTDLIASGHVVETTDRGTPHKGGSGRPPLLVTLSAPGGRRGRGRHRPRAHPGRGRRPDRHGSSPRTLAVRRRRRPRRARRSTRPRRWCATRCRAGGLARGRSPGRRHVRAGAPGPPLVPDQHRHPAAAGGTCSPATSWNGGSASRCSPTTTPTSAPSPSSTTAPPAGVTTSSTSSSPAASGPGIVLGGRLHRGATGIAGEIGHVQVGEDGQVCRCGNRGCLETLVAAPRLLEPAPAGVRRDADDRAGPRARRGRGRRRTAGAHRRRPDGRPGPGRPLQQPQPRGSWSSAARSAPRPSLLARHPRPRSTATPSRTPRPRSGVVAGELGDRAEVVGAVALAIATVAAG